MFEIEFESENFTSFDGTKVNYEVHGQGEPLVLVYGIACLFNHWHKQVEYFSKNRKVIMFDFRGHHATPIPKEKENLSINAISQDLVLLMKHLNIQSADFVGHSFGSQVLLDAYASNPELFKSMSFINGFYKNPFHRILDKKVLTDIINKIKKTYNATPKWIDKIWKSSAFNPLLIPISNAVGGFKLGQTKKKDIQIYYQGVSQIDVRVFITLFEQMIQYNGAKILQSITCPLQIICGTADTITPEAQQRRFADKNPNCKFIKIDQGSHCVQLDFPKQINLHIEEFINPQ